MISLKPHSLGQSVEWKRLIDDLMRLGLSLSPTRWGNQLNGNNWTNHCNPLTYSIKAPLAGAIS